MREQSSSRRARHQAGHHVASPQWLGRSSRRVSNVKKVAMAVNYFTIGGNLDIFGQMEYVFAR